MLDVHIGAPLFRTQLVPGPESSKCPHSVLRIQLSGCERWIIDSAGCQYGFREVLVPYEKYMTDKVCRILGQPSAYDWTEVKDLDFFDTVPLMNQNRRQKESRKLEREARKHFAGFVDSRVIKEVLDGSSVAFNGEYRVFEDAIKEHMMEFARRKLAST